MRPRALSCGSIIGTTVKNKAGEDLGSVKEIMLNTQTGDILYMVLSFGGFMGLGDKYFAIPFEAFNINTENETFVLNVDKERLQNAPGFDKDNWPSTANHDYVDQVYSHYGYTPRWKRDMVEA